MRSSVCVATNRIWGGRANPSQVKPPPKGIFRRTKAELKSGLRLINQLGEEWYRQFIVWRYLRRGYIVLFDRHFLFDYYFYDVAGNEQERSLSSRLHGQMLERFYPRPDLVIFLDAPAEVLLARKQEGTLETMEHRRQEYLQLQDLVPSFVTVDVTQPQESVIHEVVGLIERFRTEKVRPV